LTYFTKMRRKLASIWLYICIYMLLGMYASGSNPATTKQKEALRRMKSDRPSIKEALERAGDKSTTMLGDPLRDVSALSAKPEDEYGDMPRKS